jgi:hypothetical protein
MKSAFVRDLADPNRPIREAWAERPGKPIRIRVHPAILRMVTPGAGPRGRAATDDESASPAKRIGQYRSWPAVHWMLECETPEEAYQLRDALRLFFDRITHVGVLGVMGALKGAAGEPDPTGSPPGAVDVEEETA